MVAPTPASGVPADLLYGLSKLVEARHGYAVADEYYDGEPGEVFASYRVQRLLARANVDRIEDLKYSATPVDVVTNRLHVNSVTAIKDSRLGDKEVADKVIADAQLTLAQLRARNELDPELDHLWHLVSKHGDAYLFVWPVTAAEIGDDQDEIQAGQDAPGYDEEYDDTGDAVVAIDIRVNCADTVMVIYDDEDPLVMSYVVKSWTYQSDQDKKDITRANLYYKDRITRWVTKAGSNIDKATSWVPYTEDGPAEIPNRTGRIPFFHFRNGRPYGTPEHKRAIGPQQIINKLVISHAATIDFNSFPQRYYMVDPMQDDPLANSIDPFNQDDEDDDPEDAGATSVLDSSPSAVWRLYGKSAGQFSAADPGAYMTPFDRYVRAMAELTDIPQHYFSKSTGETPSGAALRTAEAPLVGKVSKRQGVYGGTLTDVFVYALKMLGFDGVSVQIGWEPAGTVTDTEGWAVVEAKRRNGVPARVALSETGYTDEQIDGWLDSFEGVDLANRVQMLLMIGQAMQALGAGIGLGVVSEPTVQALIDKVLGTAAGGLEATSGYAQEQGYPAGEAVSPPAP